MARISLDIGKDFFDTLSAETGGKFTERQLLNEAFVLYRTAITAVQQGRVLITCDADGRDLRRVEMPCLTRAKNRAHPG